MSRRLPSWAPPVCAAVGLVALFAGVAWLAYQAVSVLLALVVYAVIGLLLISVSGTGEPVEPYVSDAPTATHQTDL